MKELYEIPECKKLLDEMFEEWSKLPRKTGGKDLLHEKQRQEIEKKYLKQIMDAAKKYQEEHPD